jgi:uncharacterized protein (DUF1330 family)
VLARQASITAKESSLSVLPTEQQLADVVASPEDGPVFMLNLLRFKAMADGIDEGITGAAAYARYSAATEPFLREVGGRLRVALAPQQTVIGPQQSEWDLILLVEYPSRAKFMEMAVNPEYLKIHAHREAALADSRLIACADLTAAALAQLG